jgi:hypothetical protein
VAAAIVPDYALSSHVAALGLVFSNGSALPDEYGNGAFVGQHCSWNRDEFNGYKVSYIPFTNGVPDGMAQDVVTGFLVDGKVRGRPVGVGLDGTGALLVADDAGNTVWRVAAADGRISDAPVETDRVATETGATATADPGTAEPEADPAAPPAEGTAPDEPLPPATD